MEKSHILGDVYNVVANNNANLRSLWLNHIVFTWRWWFGVVLAIMPWIIWIKIRDKNNEVRLLFVGLLVGIITNMLDIMGICFGLWYYDYKITPIIETYFPWDFSLFPVSIMLLLQFKPEVKAYIKAIVFAAISAFAFEPLFTWMDMYVHIRWKSWYSFIIYITLYLIFNKIYNSKFLNRGMDE